jgi:hypothetical protein
VFTGLTLSRWRLELALLSGEQQKRWYLQLEFIIFGPWTDESENDGDDGAYCESGTMRSVELLGCLEQSSLR